MRTEVPGTTRHEPGVKSSSGTPARGAVLRKGSRAHTRQVHLKAYGACMRRVISDPYDVGGLRAAFRRVGDELHRLKSNRWHELEGRNAPSI